VSATWAAVLLVGCGTIAIKAAGPVVIGGRDLPPRVMGLFDALAPALLAALVATQAFGGDRELVIDARTPGIAVAAIAVWLRAPVLVTIGLAAGTTAVARLVA